MFHCSSESSHWRFNYLLRFGECKSLCFVVGTWRVSEYSKYCSSISFLYHSWFCPNFGFAIMTFDNAMTVDEIKINYFFAIFERVYSLFLVGLFGTQVWVQTKSVLLSLVQMLPSVDKLNTVPSYLFCISMLAYHVSLNILENTDSKVDTKTDI